MKKSHFKQMKGLRKENVRLKKIVAEQALDIDILKGLLRETSKPGASGKVTTSRAVIAAFVTKCSTESFSPLNLASSTGASTTRIFLHSALDYQPPSFYAANFEGATTPELGPALHNPIQRTGSILTSKQNFKGKPSFIDSLRR